MCITIRILCISSFVIPFCFASCPTHYWGKDCVNYCGHCLPSENEVVADVETTTVLSEIDSTTAEMETKSVRIVDPYLGRECNPENGHCFTDKCMTGWKGKRCDEAKCKDCGPGTCVSPNLCSNCKDISRVGPDCTSIRIEWFVASLFAYAVLIVTLIICTYSSNSYMKKLPKRSLEMMPAPIPDCS